MKILELFSGTECLSNAFRARGHECFTYRKATDIWTNHPQTEFLPPCRNGDPCHQSAPRGTRQGLQGIQDKALRSAYPPRLCEHIVSICERYFDREPLPVSWHIDAKPPVQLELFSE